MSTLKATNLQHASATSPNITLGSDGSVAVGGGNISPSIGMRNRIINGDMRIDQRNAGAAVTVNSNTTFYPIDRFACYGQPTDGVFTAQRSTTAPTGFVNSLIATVTTADASIGATQEYGIYQNIEGFNVADLGWGTANAQTVTLSFWVRSSLTGTHSGSLSNNAYNRAYAYSYTISAANTWEYKTVTIAGDTSGTWLTDNSGGIRIRWNLGSGSTYLGTGGVWGSSFLNGTTGSVQVISTNGATFYITGVQLEKGSVATPFEFRSIGQELQLCQRYYQTNFAMQQGSFGYFMSYYGGTNAVSPICEAQVPMRVAPTATITNSSIEYYSYAGAWTSTTLIVSAYSATTIFIYCASDGDGRGKLIRTGSGGSAPAPYYILNAEL